MSEKEIRRIIRETCAYLDRHARKAVYPAMLGAGLALGGCGDDMDKPAADAGADMGPDAVIPRDAGVYSAPDVMYMAPGPDRGKFLDGIIPQDRKVYGIPDVGSKYLDGIIPRDHPVYGIQDIKKNSD